MKKKELNIEEIKNLIPHRYPFLLIDKLIDIIPDTSATGIKNVTFNENFFQGHFESMSVMPGALIIESMAQSAGTLVMYSLKKKSKNTSVYLLTVDKAKFRKPVYPNEKISFHVKFLNNVKSVYKFSGEAFKDDIKVCESEFSAMITYK